MEIISLKRNAGDAVGYDKEKEAYEIVYRAAEGERVSNVTVALDSEDGKEIDAAAIKFQRKAITPDEFTEVLITAVENNSGAMVTSTMADLGEAISSRIRLVDGVELRIGEHVVTGPLSAQLIKMIRTRRANPDAVNTDDWLALIHFTESLYDNTDPYIREQLYAWFEYQVQNGRLTLTPEGKFLGYKGCKLDSEGNVVSIHSGPGFVNGEAQNGHLVNNPGTVVEMAREDVNNDPNETCSTGLHVGSYDYAHSFSSGAVVLVEVDPRDVVSVPYDYNGQKIRTCKYKVIKIVEDELDDFSFDFSAHNATKDNEEQIDEATLAQFFANNDEIPEIVYNNKSGEIKKYTNVEVQDVEDDRVFVTHDGGFATFLFEGIVEIAGAQVADLIEAEVIGEVDLADLEAGSVIETLIYDGEEYNELLVESVGAHHVLTTDDDGQYRRFNEDKIEKIEIAE